MAVKASAENFGDLLVAFFIRYKASRGERLLSFGVERFGGREKVDECQATLFGHGFYGSGIEDEIGILFVTIGEITLSGLIFKGHW